VLTIDNAIEFVCDPCCIRHVLEGRIRDDEVEGVLGEWQRRGHIDGDSLVNVRICGHNRIEVYADDEPSIASQVPEAFPLKRRIYNRPRLGRRQNQIQRSLDAVKREPVDRIERCHRNVKSRPPRFPDRKLKEYHASFYRHLRRGIATWLNHPARPRKGRRRVQSVGSRRRLVPAGSLQRSAIASSTPIERSEQAKIETSRGLMDAGTHFARDSRNSINLRSENFRGGAHVHENISLSSWVDGRPTGSMSTSNHRPPPAQRLSHR